MPKHTAHIAGTKHRGTDNYVKALAAETPLVLEPEPTNKYDPHAVKVIHDGRHIGYVPRDLSKDVAKICNEARLVSAKIDETRRLIIEYRT